MADTKPVQTPSLDIDTLANAISRGIADAAANSGPVKQEPITRYRSATPVNPKALRDHERAQFTRDYYQNEVQILLWQVSDDDVRNLNALKPGRYMGNKVEVVERGSENGEPPKVNIRYSNATIEMRFELKNLFRSFSELLRLILAEQQGAATAA